MKSHRKEWLWSVLVLVVSGLVVFLLIKTEPQPSGVVRTVAEARVALFQVQAMDLQPKETLTGRLRPARRAALRFEVAGTVVERAVEPGRKVAANEVLLRLADGDYQDALAEAQAQLALEEANVARDQRLLQLAARNRRLQGQEVERLRKLGTNMVSRTRLDEARQRLVQLQSEEARLRFSVQTSAARLELRRAAVERAQRNVQRTRLTAPFDGVVNDVHAQVGDFVSSAQSAVDIVDVAALELYVEVRSELAALLAPDDAVSVRVKGQSYEGSIIALQRDPNPQTFTYAVRVRLPAGAGLPGMLADAEFGLHDLRGVVAVPAAALAYDEGATYVFQVQDGVLRRAPVVLGTRVGDWQVIREGLAAGTTIVSRDVAALSDGQRVIADAPPSAEAAGLP